MTRSTPNSLRPGNGVEPSRRARRRAAEIGSTGSRHVSRNFSAIPAVRARLVGELHDNEGGVGELRTKLSLLGDEGLATQLDTATSELAHLTAEHERLEARAAAAKLLFETFARRRTELHRYVAPFREGIESLGRLVFGSTLEVELADDLRIARRTLHGVTLDFADLSTGAKEQLGMISRLACASIVAADGVRRSFSTMPSGGATPGSSTAWARPSPRLVAPARSSC